MTLQKNFDTLVQEQRTLGYTDDSGLRSRLNSAGNTVERLINDNATWLAEGDARKLTIALLTMRHYETEYRLNQFELNRELFEKAYKSFTDTFDNIDGTPEMKGALEDEVKTYAETFAAWCEAYARAYPMRGLIEFDSERMLPRADEIIAYARATAARAGGRARPVATVYPHRHHRRRHRHGRARPRLLLADRPQHHPAAARACRSDETARRRRHLGPHSGDTGAR